jgi:hypothetical protein
VSAWGLSRWYDEVPLRFIEWTTKRHFGSVTLLVVAAFFIAIIAFAYTLPGRG